MKNETFINNNFNFINTLGINGLISSIRRGESVVQINSTIRYDAIFAFISNGSGLHTVIQEMTYQLEKFIIISTLEHTGWNKSKAAKILKINYKTLYYKMKKYSV